MIKADRLSRLKLFAGVPASTLGRLGEAMDEKTFSAGDTVIRQGEKSNSLFLIAQGSVSVETHSKVVARLEAEEFFGEMSFLSNEPHSATVQASEKTVVYILPRAAVDALIKREPAAAIDQLTGLFAAVSGRLRRTTEEFVTVFDVARLIGGTQAFDQLIRSVLERLHIPLGHETTIAFYRWNPFNDEYALVAAIGPEQHSFPLTVENSKPLNFQKGQMVQLHSDGQAGREGLFVYYNDAPNAFDAGKRQLMDTVSAVMVPALESARAREEAEARERLTRSKQAGAPL